LMQIHAEDIIQKLFPGLPGEDVAAIQKRLHPKPCRKGEYLVVTGQVQEEMYFIQSGVQMSFFENEKKSHVVAFTYPPDICAVPESFSLQKPSPYFLSCLTDSEMYSLHFNDLQMLFDQSRNIERAFRHMTEKVLAGIIQRHIEAGVLTIEERYKNFCQRSPHLLHLVPHKYIASYLGMDPTNFSKSFNQVKI